MAYLPDHEPALRADRAPRANEWTSGYDLAADVDLLVHDAQFADDAYPDHVGWGHSCISDAVRFAALAGVGTLVPFHYDPAHDDATRDRIHCAGRELLPAGTELVAAREGATIIVARRATPAPALTEGARAAGGG
jgi:ribonuclease BN (tRNA processing enzyme)